MSVSVHPSDSSLAELARRIRVHVLRMTHKAGSSHVGSSFSMAEILAVLYGACLRVRPDDPDWPERDRLIVSKGHACAGVYAALAESGFFPIAWLQSFYGDGARLAGHVTKNGVPGIEVSSGSLGHGLSIACGIALAAKRDGARHRVFTLLSDGECDEGSVWEAVLFAPHHRLDNLVAIIDYNKIQSLGSVKEVLDLDPLADKLLSFGWSVCEIDGHNIPELSDSLSSIPAVSGRPTCIIAHTIKGKGVSFMENKLLWHYRSPDPQEFRLALNELGISE